MAESNSNPMQTSKLPQLDPFTSAESIVQSLQVQDAQLLQAALIQIDKRATALNAKVAPRGSADLLLDYLKRYPGVEGIFNAWDWANKTNNSPLTTSILSCLTSLIRLLSTDPFSPSPELIKTLLSPKYFPYLERSLNPGRNDVTTAALKLSNVLVGFAGGRFAKKLFGVFTWNPKVTTRLYKTRLRTMNSTNVLSKPDIRTLLVLLVMGFMSASDVRLKSQVIETKGLLSGVVKGLNEDPEIVVNLVLETLYREIVGDRRIGLEARRNVFDESCINELVKLYHYPLPESSDLPLSSSHPSLSIHRFFYALTDWLSDQIASSPIGRSSGPQKVLSNVLKSLSVTEDQTHRTLGLYILSKSPVLCGQFWSKFPSSLDPRLSSRWISAVTFATQVVALPVSTNLILPSNLSASSSNDNNINNEKLTTFSPPSVSSILDTILPPSTTSSLNRTWYTKSLTHQNPLVSFLSSIFLLSILQKASKVLQHIVEVSMTLEEGEGGRWRECGRKVREEVKGRLPDVGIVVGLMSKTVAATTTTSKSTSSASTSTNKSTDKKGQQDESSNSGALLRTNIALRLLYLYHRVAPSLIATLKFDFGKLPQTFAKQGRNERDGSKKNTKAEKSDVMEEDEEEDKEVEEKDEQGGEGLKAMSSAYALRLAAVHETGTAGFNRPGDYFKSLVPLFTLYRVPSLTPSNRSLLLSILRRQLSTPLLFGDDLDQVDIWLESLPIPRDEDDTSSNTSIDWFEKIVQKTLTTPIKSKDEEEDADNNLSPIMKTVLSTLSSSNTFEVRSFMRSLFVAFVSYSTSLERPIKLFESIKEAWKEDQGAKETIKYLQDVIDVLKGKGVKDKKTESVVKIVEALGKEEEVEKVRDQLVSLSPRKENLFMAIEGKPELLKRLIEVVPLPILVLHALSAATTTLISTLPSISPRPASIVASAQIALYRFINATSAEDRQAIGQVLVAIYHRADQSGQRLIRERVAAKEGLLGLFEKEMKESETKSLIPEFIGTIFTPNRTDDLRLVEPFCSIVASSVDLDRISSCAPLLPFFNPALAIPLTSTVLRSLSRTNSAELERVLGAAFERLGSAPSSPQLDQFWIQHLTEILELSSSSNEILGQSVDHVLVKGCDSLFAPSSVASTPTRSKLVLPYAQWTSTLLNASSKSSSGLTEAQGTVLAALVAKSQAARQQLVERLSSTTFVVGLEAPLRALLEVAQFREEPIELAASVVEQIVESVLTRDDLTEDAIKVIELSPILSPVARPVIRSILERSLASTTRDGFKPSTIALVSKLAVNDQELKVVLEGYVNGSFEGLTRKFVDAKEDEAVETELSIALCQVLSTQRVTLKGHLVEPLVTAIATNRLAYTETIDLAIAICSQHQFKDNEVTRHLNEIFASSPFQASLSTPSSLTPSVTSTLKLVLALAQQSPPAALNARLVDRVLPFYRGTLSPLDRQLFDSFLRIEASSTTSLSSIFKSWNPSTDSSVLLDGTRIGALGATQKSFVRRSWARAFASSRQVYTDQEDAHTYDPRLLVSFVLALVEEDELRPQEWTVFLECGALGTVVAALASSEDGLRNMARATLAGLAKRIGPLTFREKDEVVLLLSHCRNAIFSPTGEPIPTSIALFLAHCASQLGTPASPLYPAFSRFLLQRPSIDMRDVPMFYSMMYSSNSDEWAAAPREERGWMVRYLTEGLTRTQDWKIYRRRQVFELLASLFHSSRQDAPLRKLILQFIVRATSIPTAARELLSRNGLVGWVAAQSPLDDVERKLFVEILGNLAKVMTFDKVTGVADLLDSLTAVIAKQVASLDLVALTTLVNYIVSRLPASSASEPNSSTSSSLVLVISRLSTVLSSIIDVLPSQTSNELARLAYSTAMTLSFVRHEVGLPEDADSRKVFTRAIHLGMEAKVESLRKEILKVQQ